MAQLPARLAATNGASLGSRVKAIDVRQRLLWLLLIGILIAILV